MFGGTPTGANLTNYMHTRTVTFPLPTLRLNSRARLEFTPTRFTLLVNLVGCEFYLEDALLHSEGSGKHVFATVVTHDVASVFGASPVLAPFGYLPQTHCKKNLR